MGTVNYNMEKTTNLEASPEQLGSSEEECVMDSSNCLLLIQQLFAEKPLTTTSVTLSKIWFSKMTSHCLGYFNDTLTSRTNSKIKLLLIFLMRPLQPNLNKKKPKKLPLMKSRALLMRP